MFREKSAPQKILGHCRRFGGLLAICWLASGGWAEPRAIAADYFLRTWKADDGLPDNSVMSIAQTHDGYLWLATFAGLARFDGVHFTILNSAKTPGLESDRFSALFEDAQGNLWIGHEHGELTRYHDGKFETFTGHETGARRKIAAISADELGEVWTLNEEGTLMRVRDGATCALPNANGVASLARDAASKLWVASNGQLAPLQDGKLFPLTGTNDFTDEYVQGICASRDGGLWVATPGRVRKWRAGVWSEDLGTNPCVTMITAMTELKSGCVAFGAVDSGLCLLTPKKNCFATATIRVFRKTGFAACALTAKATCGWARTARCVTRARTARSLTPATNAGRRPRR